MRTRGIDWRQLRALIGALLTVDFFGESRHQQAGSALAAGALFQSGIALIAGVLLYLGLPPFHLALAGLTLVAVLTAMVLGPEAATVLKASNDNLAGLPVSVATVRTARAVHAILYIILGASGAAIPIAVFVGFAAENVMTGFATWLAAMHQTLFFASVVAGIHAILGSVKYLSRLRTLVGLFIGTLLVGALLFGIRPLPDLRAAIDGHLDLLSYYPVTWFAAEATAVSETVPRHLLLLSIGGSAVALALGACAAVLKETEAATAPPPGPIRVFFSKLFVRENERATFDFTLNILPREGDRALRVAPFLAFPAALLTVGAAIYDAKERLLFVRILLMVTGAYLPVAVLLLSRSRHAAARWVFDCAPIAAPKLLRCGVYKALIFSIVIPMFAVLELSDAAISGPSTALLHAPLVFIAMAWVLDRSVELLPDPFPFGELPERLAGGAGEGAMALAFGLTLAGFLDGWFVRDITSAALASAVAGGALYVKRRLHSR